MDNCGGQSYDGAGNMVGRYAGVLTLIRHQFPKFILLLDKFLLLETSHTNCWIHPCLTKLCLFEYLFSIVCLHRSWKAPIGSGQLSIHFTYIFLEQIRLGNF